MSSFSTWEQLKKLRPYYQQHFNDLKKAAVYAFALMLVQAAKPLLLGSLVDSIASKEAVTPMLLSGGGFLLVILGGMFFSYQEMIIMSKFGLSVILKLKENLFHHLLNQGTLFFGKHKTGWLISRVESDSEELKNFFSGTTVYVVRDTLGLITVFAVICYAHFETGVYLGVFSLFLIGLVIFAMDYMKSFHDKARTAYADLTGFISEYIRGLSVIRAYSREQQVSERLSSYNHHRYRAELNASFAEYGFWSVFSFVTEILFVGVVLYFGIQGVLSGEMSLGTLVMLLECIRQMVYPLMSFSENFQEIQKAAVALNRISKLMDEQTFNESSPEYDMAKAPFREIRFEHVGFYYNKEEWVLKDLELTLEAGQKIALVGASGSGKTTLSSLLCCFMHPKEGRILVDGMDLSKVSSQVWRRRLGLVLQDVQLFPGTVIDNLTMMDKSISHDVVKMAAMRLGLHERICALPDGYSTLLSEHGGNLSLGERQLLSFIRAMARDPELLILDEATASMDPSTEYKIQSALETLMEGRTAVIVVHRLSTIESVDKIVVMEQGKILESGTHFELLSKNGAYAHLHKLQRKTA
jgi:ATP-binding cassette subfamily B protein